MSARDSFLFHKILKRWKFLMIIAVVVIFIVLYYICLKASHNELSCYKEVLSREDLVFIPSDKAIFFHETSCKGSLDPRQECAVESAALAHPNWQINVLFTGPISETFTKRINSTFSSYKNVEFRRIFLKKYAEDTPAFSLVNDGRLDGSNWRVSHTSDVLRYITLYKYGGIYLDMDVIVAKSLEELSENWAALESKTYIGAGAMRFSGDGIGRLFAHTTIIELEDTFSGSVWGNNGPGVITRVLKRICGTDNITAMTADTCLGFNVYDHRYFYPVAWQQAESYFQASQTKTMADTYGYHVWNKITHNLKIERKSMYDELAKKYCPSVYNSGLLQKT